jgi:2-dehydro-3-deoxy-D-arabinonate dehydratase
VTALWRVLIDERPRLARGGPDEGPQELLQTMDAVGELLARPGGLDAALAGPGAGGVPASASILAPVDEQPVWAAGVTYERSRTARKEESTQGDVYDRVYDAERPELFLKATPGTVVGTHADIGIRADSTWDVPEPELGLVLDGAGEVVAYCLGNDVSSRSIEGENPLYLPQAKVYDLSCAIGPCLVPASAWSPGPETSIELTIRRGDSVLYADEVALSSMRRTHDDLRDWLVRAVTFPRGVVLLTGTSIVPGPEVTLLAGDDVVIRADGLGELRNRVRTVGTA